jgi:hypothetical protein
MQALQMFIFIMPLLMVKDARGFGAPKFDLSCNNMCHQISNAMGQVQKIDRQRIRNELHRFSGRARTNKKLLMWIRHGFDLARFLRDRLYSDFGFTCEEDLVKAVTEAGDYKKLFNIDPSTIDLKQYRKMSKTESTGNGLRSLKISRRSARPAVTLVTPKRLTSSMPASTNLSPTPTPTSRH